MADSWAVGNVVLVSLVIALNYHARAGAGGGVVAIQCYSMYEGRQGEGLLL